MDKLKKPFLNHLINSMRDGFSVLDKQGIHIDVNPALCKMTGFSKKELVGTGAPHLYWPPEEYETIKKAFEKTLQSKFANFELIFMRKNGERFPVIVSLSELKDKKGNVISYFATVKDITECKRIENQLKEAQEELRRREKIVTTGALASGVAHEIRNPLNIIGMTVQYLQSQLKPHDSKRELTEAIIEKVERLDMVTRELSSFGRVRQLNIKKENLRKSLNLNLSLVKSKCRLRGVKIKKVYSKLPPVEMDSAQMDKVFLNIIDNAVEVMSARGVLTVSTEFDEENQIAVIKIHNTGTPIPKKHLAHIFEPFYTVKKKGTGLGLAIADKVVLAHKGLLRVKNEYGRKNRGVTFIIELPIHSPPRKRGEFKN